MLCGQMTYDDYLDEFERYMEDNWMTGQPDVPQSWDAEVYEIIYDFVRENLSDFEFSVEDVVNDFEKTWEGNFHASYNSNVPAEHFVEYMDMSHEQKNQYVMELLREKTFVWQLRDGGYLVYTNF